MDFTLKLMILEINCNVNFPVKRKFLKSNGLIIQDTLKILRSLQICTPMKNSKIYAFLLLSVQGEKFLSFANIRV